MAASAKVSTITLRLSDSFTGPLKTIAAATSGFQRQLAGANMAIGRTAASMENAAMRLTAALSIPAGLGIAKSVSEFGKFEDATIDAKRAIDGFSDETADRFKKLAQEMGASFSDTFTAAAEAGKAGLSDAADIEQFLRLQRKVAVAFELPGEEAAKQLMSLKNGYRLTIPELQKFSDQINTIADSSSTTVPDLINYSARVAPAAALLKINRELVNSFGAVGLSAGISSERMATAFNKMTQSMVVGSEASTSQKSGFAALGLDAEKIAKLASNDATEAADKIMTALSGITDSADQQRIALQIFGKESADEILSVIGNLKELNRLRNAATTGSAGSVDAEYQRRQEAMTNGIDRMKASFQNLGVTIGARFAPKIRQITALVERFNNYLIATPEAIDKIAQSLVAMVASGPSLFIVAKGLRLAGLALSGLALLTSPLARLGQLAGLAAVGFGRSGRAAFGARGAFFALAASTIKAAAGFGLVGLAGFAVYKALPGIGRAFKALQTDIDLSAAMSSASAAFDALMDGRPEMAARHAKMAFDSILKAGKRLGANLKTALGEGWDLAVAAIDEKFPAFKGFRESVSGLASSIGNLFKSIAGIDTGNAGEKIQSLGKQLADASLRLGAAILRTLAEAIDSLTAAIDRYNEAAPEGGIFAGLKSAFDGLPAVGKMLVLGGAFRVFAGSIGVLGAAGTALRGLSLARLISGVKGLGALKLGAIAYGLTELGKSYGLLSKDVDSGAVAAAFMALPTAISAASMAASGAKSLAGWGIAGAKAASKYLGSFRVVQGLGKVVSAAWSSLTGAAARAAGFLASTAYAAGVRAASAITSAISAAWNALKSVVARWAGLAAGAAYAAGSKAAAVIGSAISALWDGLKTFAAKTAGAAAGAAYALLEKAGKAIGDTISLIWDALKHTAAKAAGAAAGAAYATMEKLGQALSVALSAAWGALKHAGAYLAGGLAGAAFSSGMSLVSFVGSAVAGAFAAAGTMGSAAMVAAGTAGTFLGGILAAAMAAAIPAAIGAAVMAGLQLVDPKGNLGGLTKPVDDAMRRWLNLPEQDTGITPGEIGRGVWGKITGTVPSIETPAMPTIEMPANDNAPTIETPAMPAPLQAMNDNQPVIQQPQQFQQAVGDYDLRNFLQDMPALNVETPTINVAPIAGGMQLPSSSTGDRGFATMPSSEPGTGADLSSLKESIGTLRGDTTAELSNLRQAVESLRGDTQSGNATLSSIDKGIAAIPGSIKLNVPWQAGGSGGKAASSAPAKNLPSTGYSAGPQ